MGFPASKDVGTLASVIRSLRTLAEEKLGYGISLAIATTPRLVALYQEDIDDALEYAGLKSGSVPYQRFTKVAIPNELSTAFAGYGLGLCQSYTNSSKCSAEETDMPVENILAVLYTRSALATSLSTMKTPYGILDWPQDYLQDFELGYDSLHSNPSEEYYWEGVRDRIRELTVIEYDHKRITKVLLLGDSALDATFLRVLEQSVGSLQDDIPEILMGDPVFAAAKGAAELARRSTYA
ncbi:hypothetical protein MMC24_001935 [Lignoscripta atroalba]|nr:hypothetical protein [Lignoscripta atroalba]